MRRLVIPLCALCACGGATFSAEERVLEAGVDAAPGTEAGPEAAPEPDAGPSDAQCDRCSCAPDGAVCGHPSDGAPPVDGSPPDVDCGPVDTPDNCGSCGHACDPLPDAGVFVASACCGAYCVVAHTNGVAGPNGFGSAGFYDCEQGYDVQLALDACALYFGPGKCVQASCGGLQVVQGVSAACITWAYGGTPASAVGHWVEGPQDGSKACACPTSADGTWH
jgi:hypothetical protein